MAGRVNWSSLILLNIMSLGGSYWELFSLLPCQSLFQVFTAVKSERMRMSSCVSHWHAISHSLSLLLPISDASFSFTLSLPLSLSDATHTSDGQSWNKTHTFNVNTLIKLRHIIQIKTHYSKAEECVILTCHTESIITHVYEFLIISKEARVNAGNLIDRTQAIPRQQCSCYFQMGDKLVSVLYE